MPAGRCANVLMMLLLGGHRNGRRAATPRGEGPTLTGLAAAAKKQQTHHGRTRIAGVSQPAAAGGQPAAADRQPAVAWDRLALQPAARRARPVLGRVRNRERTNRTDRK